MKGVNFILVLKKKNNTVRVFWQVIVLLMILWQFALRWPKLYEISVFREWFPLQKLYNCNICETPNTL